MRRLLIAGNWKMNTTLESGRSLASAIAAAVAVERDVVEVLLCPPFPYLMAVGSAIEGSGVELGGQNAWFEALGAFTGETAVDMLEDLGCRYVILGHSERRHILGETDELINKKVSAALKRGLKVLFCVGELLSDREAGRTEAVLNRQMENGLSRIDAAVLESLVIAYEPVWAIGTGVTATPEQAESAQAHLRKWLCSRYNSKVGEKTRILYGGSVNPDNARAILGQPNVDGALVGNASLKAETFLPIVNVAIELSRPQGRE